MIIASLTSEYIKKIVPRKEVFLRPTNQPCKCKYYITKCKNIKEVGFPSTHAFMMTFFAIMVYMYHKKINLQVTISLIITLIIIIQRYTSLCHNSLQIIAGTLLGSIFGILYYNFILI
jgi:membrane-associated phospholipid phosphatase